MKNIIIVDMQKGFINDNNAELIYKINKYLQEHTFDNIFFTKCINNTKSPYYSILKWNGMTEKQEQDIAIDMPPNSRIITKNCYGISSRDIKLFKSLDISEMEICGTDIDACCLAIAFNLFDNNIRPVILTELCGTSSKNKNINEYAQIIMKRQFGSECVK